MDDKSAESFLADAIIKGHLAAEVVAGGPEAVEPLPDTPERRARTAAVREAVLNPGAMDALRAKLAESKAIADGLKADARAWGIAACQYGTTDIDPTTLGHMARESIELRAKLTKLARLLREEQPSLCVKRRGRSWDELRDIPARCFKCPPCRVQAALAELET